MSYESRLFFENYLFILEHKHEPGGGGVGKEKEFQVDSMLDSLDGGKWCV